MTEHRKNHIQAGEQSFQRWRNKTLADPEVQAIYEEESAKKALWLQLVEAREAAGLTQVEMARRIGVSQAQIARIEKSGYYRGLCFAVWVHRGEAGPFPLGDGGLTDWVAKLTASRKERCVIGALGTEALATVLAPTGGPGLGP